MKTITMLPVTSSQLKSIGYDAETKTLYVEFLKGIVYRYNEVPEETYDAFVVAESSGKFFGEFIKGVFEYERIEETVNTDNEIELL